MSCSDSKCSSHESKTNDDWLKYANTNEPPKNSDDDKMQRTQIMMIPQSHFLSVEYLKKRHLSENPNFKDIDIKLNLLIEKYNNRSLNMIDVMKFNHISGLYVNYGYQGKYYSFELNFDGRKLFFCACFRRFNKSEYDSDDEDAGKMYAYEFVPFKVLIPNTRKDGTQELTVNMYFEFVDECLKMKEADHKYMRF